MITGNPLELKKLNVQGLSAKVMLKAVVSRISVHVDR